MALAPVWARAVVSYHENDPNPGSVIINREVGAERFYSAGYYGYGALVANVEAGHIWNQHETLTQVNTFVNDPSLGDASQLYDYHATEVGFILAGLGPPAPGGGYYYSQLGMAPAATLVSAAIATGWGSDTGQFNISTDSLTYAYTKVMQTGVPTEVFPGLYMDRQADVVNSSWGYADPAGTAQETMIVDALAYANHQTVVMAAGNHDGTQPVQVVGPASGYNHISVGALGTDVSTPPYSTLAPFSNTGPNDFHNPTSTGNATVPGVRPAVDIVAPGTNLFLAAYTGTTGSNPFKGNDPYPGRGDLYFIDQAGTSFASPIVAGGAALVVQAGYDRFGGGRGGGWAGGQSGPAELGSEDGGVDE